MKIKQVEELVDITGKNIRFYESKGLLNPGRADNGYREYDLNDVKRLKEIKLLRKIGISVEDIKLILEGKLDFEVSLTRHRDTLRDSVNSIENMIKITDSILSSHSSPDKLDVDMLLNEIENMEKEGAGFVNIDKTDIHMKKKDRSPAGGGSNDYTDVYNYCCDNCRQDERSVNAHTDTGIVYCDSAYHDDCNYCFYDQQTERD